MTKFGALFQFIAVVGSVVAIQADSPGLKSDTPSGPVAPPSPSMASGSTSLTGPSPNSPFIDTSNQHQSSPQGSSCDLVSVLHDAVYCIQGPACSGRGAMPTGIQCPNAGATAVDGCTTTVRSFDGNWGLCVAPVSAVCRKLANSDTWGCVWP
jgi:hypothetical protein